MDVTNAEKEVIQQISKRLVDVDSKQKSKWGKDVSEVVAITEDVIQTMMEVEVLFEKLGGDTLCIQEQGTVFSRAYHGKLGCETLGSKEDRLDWVGQMVFHDMRNKRVAVK